MHANPIPGSFSPQQVWFFRHTGYILVAGGLPKQRVLRLRGLVDNLFQQGRDPCERSPSGKVVRVSDLASRSPALIEEFSSDVIVDPLESLLGPNIEFIRNRHNHATVGVESTYRTRLHRDVLQWSRNIVSVIVYLDYLDECSDAWSATRVIPGSHLLPLVGTPNNGLLPLVGTPNNGRNVDGGAPSLLRPDRSVGPHPGICRRHAAAGRLDLSRRRAGHER